MYTHGTWSVSRVISAALAAAIVAGGALAMDRGHIAAAPRGVVEVGELMPVADGELYATRLPEIAVTASRLGNERAVANRRAKPRATPPA